jgi:large subunit ribosomal protein L7e
MASFVRIIPESVKKKTARDAKVLKELKERRDKSKKERSEKRKVILANAERYHKEYTDAEKKVIDAKRQAKSVGNFFVEPEHKVAFVIRIKG